uniref:Ionotropic glutamate receptor L-glutamate and glycine-binding domain-containing protein n=1 Tax=Megaselia scalaris TaxID=36166 RepID=T1H2M0_MEGSC
MSISKKNKFGLCAFTPIPTIIDKSGEITPPCGVNLLTALLTVTEPPEGTTYEGNERYEGYSMDLIDAIAKQLGFKYVFKMARDGKYGGWDAEKKSWNGLIKELLDGEADLGICDLTMTSARRKAVDFTPPFMTLGISI